MIGRAVVNDNANKRGDAVGMKIWCETALPLLQICNKLRCDLEPLRHETVALYPTSALLIPSTWSGSIDY